MSRRVPWLASAWGLGLMAEILLIRWAGLGWPLPACPLKALTGYPCATCGATRCMLALGQGQLAAAWHWHPVLFVLTLTSPLVVAWDLRRAWWGRSYPPLPEAPGWRWGAAALLAGTWLLQILRGV
jgi:hypothetical protein